MTRHPALADGLHPVPPGKLACVVTHLDMRLPPPSPEPRHAPAGFTLRQVPQPGLAWYRDLFRRVGAPWLWSSRLLLADAALQGILADPDVVVLAADHAGLDQGLVELDFRVAGEAELAFFGLVPGLTGRGVGRWMLDRALGLAWSRPIARLRVHTCTLDHPAALGFYRSAGFVPVRTGVEIMDDPRRTGLLPPSEAPHVPWV